RERRGELRWPAHRSTGHRRGPRVLQGRLRPCARSRAPRRRGAHRGAARRAAVTERLLIGTANPGKQREYRELLGGLDLEPAVPWPAGRAELCDGEVRGDSTHTPRGMHGFGYDPIFEISGDGRTMAELVGAEKHRVSHRGLAVAKLRAYLAEEPR